ncbi:hypothetical protein HDU93_007587 [Gonapodya sp. JEL0774]|nr:hypothetical protein HDU93_007587 [Gonapodya sp. JEL0774]
MSRPFSNVDFRRVVPPQKRSDGVIWSLVAITMFACTLEQNRMRKSLASKRTPDEFPENLRQAFWAQTSRLSNRSFRAAAHAWTLRLVDDCVLERLLHALTGQPDDSFRGAVALSEKVFIHIYNEYPQKFVNVLDAAIMESYNDIRNGTFSRYRLNRAVEKATKMEYGNGPFFQRLFVLTGAPVSSLDFGRIAVKWSVGTDEDDDDKDVTDKDFFLD